MIGMGKRDLDVTIEWISFTRLITSSLTIVNASPDVPKFFYAPPYTTPKSSQRPSCVKSRDPIAELMSDTMIAFDLTLRILSIICLISF